MGEKAWLSKFLEGYGLFTFVMVMNVVLKNRNFIRSSLLRCTIIIGLVSFLVFIFLLAADDIYYVNMDLSDEERKVER